MMRLGTVSDGRARPLLQRCGRAMGSSLVPRSVSYSVFAKSRSGTHFSARAYHATRSVTMVERSDSPAPSFVLFDSLSSTYKTLPSPDVTQAGKGLAWYTCGPTVYAPAHLGHARTYVCLDIVRRVLEHAQANSTSCPPPLFVMNITDVHDKILAAAKESGEDPSDLARRFEVEFWQDLDSLGCLRPHVVMRVTEHVETDIVPYIERLVEEKIAYVVDNGVYFDVREFESQMGHVTKYGKLGPPSAATDFFSNHEAPPSDNKRDSRDFALWKARKEGEDVYWPSPWGEGRPGWHIECSAMIESVQQRFHESHIFQVHAGGVDLKFPHHTNEIAQAEAYHCHRLAVDGEWIRHWVHTGHLHIGGMKMSKSLKNFVTIRQLISEDALDSVLSSPGDDFRLWCLGLSGSYRGPATYSKERIDEARTIRQKLVKCLIEGEEWLKNAGDLATKRWTENDMELHSAATSTVTKCRRASLGCQEMKYFDMDGSSYVQSLVDLADVARAYVMNVPPHEGPTEPLYAALRVLRDKLSLVGFSEKTVCAGLHGAKCDGAVGHIRGGEEALADHIAVFRSAVRQNALGDVHDMSATDRTKAILQLCDEARDVTLPSIGLELYDEKAVDCEEAPKWRFCLPLPQQPLEEKAPPNKDINNNMKYRKLLQNVTISPRTPVEDLFRLGRYKRVFSQFDDEDIPTHMANGCEVSNTMRKALIKKRKKFLKEQKKFKRKRKQRKARQEYLMEKKVRRDARLKDARSKEVE